MQTQLFSGGRGSSSVLSVRAAESCCCTALNLQGINVLGMGCSWSCVASHISSGMGTAAAVTLHADSSSNGLGSISLLNSTWGPEISAGIVCTLAASRKKPCCFHEPLHLFLSYDFCRVLPSHHNCRVMWWEQPPNPSGCDRKGCCG